MSISPAEVKAGESVGISAIVTNAGEVEGQYQIELRIDGTVKSSKTITLTGAASQKVTFGTFEYDAGKHNVDINGKTGTFNVLPVTTIPKSSSSGGWIISSIIAFLLVFIISILVVWRRSIK